MRPLTPLLLFLILVIAGCTKAPTRVQINDSLNYITANPIEALPVTYWYQLADQQKQNIHAELANQQGPPGISLTDDNGNKISLHQNRVTSSHLTRQVSVKQGSTVLYQQETTLTPQNLDAHTTWTITSDQWDQLPTTTQDISFSVEYWRHYKMDKVKGHYAPLTYTVQIPHKLPAATQSP